MYLFLPPDIATEASPFTSDTPLTDATYVVPDDSEQWTEGGVSRMHRSSVLVHHSVASFSSHVVPDAFHALGPEDQPVPPPDGTEAAGSNGDDSSMRLGAMDPMSSFSRSVCSRVK